MEHTDQTTIIRVDHHTTVIHGTGCGRTVNSRVTVTLTSYSLKGQKNMQSSSSPLKSYIGSGPIV